jgi:hypothetical protein
MRPDIARQRPRRGFHRFPRDRDWSYIVALLGMTAIQWGILAFGQMILESTCSYIRLFLLAIPIALVFPYCTWMAATMNAFAH